jgi:hypothetical protein
LPSLLILPSEGSRRTWHHILSPLKSRGLDREILRARNNGPWAGSNFPTAERLRAGWCWWWAISLAPGKQQRIRIKGPVDTSVLHLLDRSRRDAARHWEDVRRYPPKSSIPSCCCRLRPGRVNEATRVAGGILVDVLNFHSVAAVSLGRIELEISVLGEVAIRKSASDLQHTAGVPVIAELKCGPAIRP